MFHGGFYNEARDQTPSRIDPTSSKFMTVAWKFTERINENSGEANYIIPLTVLSAETAYPEENLCLEVLFSETNIPIEYALASITEASKIVPKRGEEWTVKAFADFKVKYGVNYPNSSAERRGYEHFSRKAIKIKNHNESYVAGQETSILGIYRHADQVGLEEDPPADFLEECQMTPKKSGKRFIYFLHMSAGGNNIATDEIVRIRKVSLEEQLDPKKYENVFTIIDRRAQTAKLRQELNRVDEIRKSRGTMSNMPTTKTQFMDIVWKNLEEINLIAACKNYIYPIQVFYAEGRECGDYNLEVLFAESTIAKEYVPIKDLTPDKFIAKEPLTRTLFNLRIRTPLELEAFEPSRFARIRCNKLRGISTSDDLTPETYMARRSKWEHEKANTLTFNFTGK